MLRTPKRDNFRLLYRYILLLQRLNIGPVTTTEAREFLDKQGFPMSRASAQRALSDMYALGILERIEDRTGGIVSCTYALSARTPLIATSRGKP